MKHLSDWKGRIALSQQSVHVFANAMTELTTNTRHPLVPAEKAVWDVAWQYGRGLERLREHSHRSVEVLADFSPSMPERFHRINSMTPRRRSFCTL